MAKENTRIPTEELKAKTSEALANVRAARKVLAPLLEAMRQTKETRPQFVRPRNTFPSAARKLVQAAVDHPVLAEVVSFDGEAVTEDLANVDLLLPLAQEVSEIAQLVDDAILVSRHEAYVSSIALYAVAKPASAHNPSLEAIVKPLGEIFDLGRRGSKNASKDVPANEG